MRVLRVNIPGTPLSVNHYKNSAAGGWTSRPEAKQFKQDVGMSLLVQTTQEQRDIAKRWKRYEVTIRIFLAAKQKGDLDNFAKLPLDALTSSGVLHSDAAVDRLTMEKHRDPDDPRTEIEVRQWQLPETAE